jgi:hypothetical protein
VHTFGDSHCNGAFESFKSIKRHHLGAILCHSFGREKLNRLNIKDYDVKENDTCIFSFGEIDCRCHIKKHITQNKSYKNIIDEIVQNYFNAIEINIKQYNNLNIYVYNVVPVPQLFNTWNDEGYPFIGTDEERKSFVLYFNKKIEENCKIYNFKFFNIYDKYIDKDGYLNKKYSDDHVHVANNKNKFIRKFLFKNKILTFQDRIQLFYDNIFSLKKFKIVILN